MINFAANLNKMIDAGLGGPLDPPRTEVAIGHRVVYTEVSGAVASFETNVIAPMKNLRVIMEPIQEGTGDPSPDNIRPIAGRDSVTVERTGVNIFDGEVVNGRYDQGEFVESGSYRCSKNPMPCYPGMAVYFRDKSNAALVLYVTLFTATGDFISTTLVSAGNWIIPAGSGARWFKVHTTASLYTAATPICIALEAPSAYAPYDGASVTVQLGTTVYGGNTEIISGQGRSTMHMVDLGTLNWNYDATHNVFYAATAHYPKKYGFTNVISSAYKTRTATSGDNWNLQDKEIGGGNNSSYIYIKDTAYSTAADLKAALNGVQACYALNTPVEFTTDPATLSTLKGTNNVWSNAGDVALEYSYYEETEGY